MIHYLKWFQFNIIFTIEDVDILIHYIYNKKKAKNYIYNLYKILALLSDLQTAVPTYSVEREPFWSLRRNSTKFEKNGIYNVTVVIHANKSDIAKHWQISISTIQSLTGRRKTLSTEEWSLRLRCNQLYLKSGLPRSPVCHVSVHS